MTETLMPLLTVLTATFVLCVSAMLIVGTIYLIVALSNEIKTLLILLKRKEDDETRS